MEMSTWIDDLKEKDPQLYADQKLAGFQSEWALHNMVAALEMLPFLNSPAENARLEAAKRVLKRKKK
jgi:hypothetical protein